MRRRRQRSGAAVRCSRRFAVGHAFQSRQCGVASTYAGFDTSTICYHSVTSSAWCLPATFWLGSSLRTSYYGGGHSGCDLRGCVTGGVVRRRVAGMGARLAGRKLGEALERPRSCFRRIEPFVQARKYARAVTSGMPKRNGWTVAEHVLDRTPDTTRPLPNRRDPARFPLRGRGLRQLHRVAGALRGRRAGIHAAGPATLPDHAAQRGGTVLRPGDSGKPALPARAPQETGGARERGSAPPHPGIAPLVRKHPRTSEPALHRRFGPERQLLTTTRLIPRRRAARHVWLDVGPAH